MEITKAQLARELVCAKSRISQLVASGMPVEASGKLDREKTLKWILKYQSGVGGGWTGQSRGKDIRERAEALLATYENHKSETESQAKRGPVKLPDPNREVTVDVLRQVSGPAEAMCFALVAVRFGCSLEQAHALGRLHCVMPLLCVEGLEYSDVENLPDPSTEDWLTVVGNIDFAAAERIYDEFDQFVAEAIAEE